MRRAPPVRNPSLASPPRWLRECDVLTLHHRRRADHTEAPLSISRGVTASWTAPTGQQTADITEGQSPCDTHLLRLLAVGSVSSARPPPYKRLAAGCWCRSGG